MITEFSPDEFMAEFFTKGFYCFNASSIMKDIEINRFETVKVQHDDECFHAEGFEFHSNYQQLTIEQLQREISRKYLIHFQHALQFDFYSEACNEHVRFWHSDAQYAMPGQNATVNCFFDHTSEVMGGRFDMMPYSGDYIGTSKDASHVASVYPEKFSIIIFNQNRNFLHKAVPSIALRRMVSFACTLTDINPILENWQG